VLYVPFIGITITVVVVGIVIVIVINVVVVNIVINVDRCPLFLAPDIIYI
jgi:hypothetical protein